MTGVDPWQAGYFPVYRLAGNCRPNGTRGRGRYVHYSVDLQALTALGADLLAAMLR